MAKLFNLARMTSTTTGTGSTIALTGTVSGYLSFASAGVANGDVIDYAIKDGTSSEIGTATYSSTGPQLTGRTVTKSTNANAAINLSGGAEIFCSPRAESLMVGTAGATDNVALRADGAGGRDIQDSALIIADTTGALSRIGGGGIPVQAKNSNNAAATGDVGERIDATLAIGSAVSLSSSVETHVLTLPLTAGEWEIQSNPCISGNALNGVTDLISALMTSATPGSWAFNNPDEPLFRLIMAPVNVGSTSLILPQLRGRVRTSSAVTYRMMIRVSFTGGTAGGYGSMWARRI